MKQKSLNSWEKIASLCILDVYKMLLYGNVVKQASTEMMKDFYNASNRTYVLNVLFSVQPHPSSICAL